MKLLLIFALKISVLIHFDYATCTATLEKQDVKSLIESLKKTNSVSSSFLNKKVHGYRRGFIDFCFDEVPGELNNKIDNKFSVISGRIINNSNDTLYLEKDFEFNLITKILNYKNKIIHKQPQLGLDNYENSRFQQSVKEDCNTLSGLDSKPPKFIIDSRWNDNDFVLDVNCFKWAVGQYDRNRFDHCNKKYKCDSVTKVLIEDSLFIFIGSDWEKCKKNREVIALAVDTSLGYHFYRKDDNGYWSHKDGFGMTMPSQLDFVYDLIKNPKDSHRGPYDNFCGYFTKNKNIEKPSFTSNIEKVISKLEKIGNQK